MYIIILSNIYLFLYPYQVSAQIRISQSKYYIFVAAECKAAPLVAITDSKLTKRLYWIIKHLLRRLVSCLAASGLRALELA